MTIDITDVGTPALLEPRQDSTRKRVNDGGKKPMRSSVRTSPSTAGPVILTHTAVKLRNVEQQLKSIPIIDQQKIDQLKIAIKSGLYEVDVKRTADKFLEMETALHR